MSEHGPECWCVACLETEGRRYLDKLGIKPDGPAISVPRHDTPASGIPRRVIFRATIGPHGTIIETW